MLPGATKRDEQRDSVEDPEGRVKMTEGEQPTTHPRYSSAQVNKAFRQSCVIDRCMTV